MVATASPTTTLEVQAAPKPASRRLLFDVARLIAALAIIWLHTPRSAALASTTVIGRFAVPFFTAGAIFFLWQSLARGKRPSLPSYAADRALRLYAPFLAWTAVYLLFKVAKMALVPNQPNDFPGIEALLIGGSYHLWFLPFLLAVSIGVFAIGRHIAGRVDRERNTALVTAALGALVALMPTPGFAAVPGSVVEFWWTALPAVFWSVALVIAYRHGAAEKLERPLATWSGLSVTIACMFVCWWLVRSPLIETIAGLSFLVFALGRCEHPLIARAATFGPLAYGIYLSHLLLIKVCESVAAKVGASPSVLLDVLTFIVAALGSTSLAWLLSRYRSTKWLVA